MNTVFPENLWCKLMSILAWLFPFARGIFDTARATYTFEDLYLTPDAFTNFRLRDLILVGESAYSSIWIDRALQPHIVVKRHRLPHGDFRRKLEDAAYQWRRAKHLPNIQPFLGLWDRSDQLPAFVALHAGSNLMDYLHTIHTTDVQKFVILYDISNALTHLHKQDPPIFHTNVKGSNVLIDQTGKVFLTDIGVHSAISIPGEVDSSVRWAAPEKVLGVALSHTKECDIWSLGMTILEVFTQRQPYVEIPNGWQIPLVMAQNRGRPARPSGVNDALWELLLGCWSYQPSERFPIEGIMAVLRFLSELVRLPEQQ